MKEIKIGRSSMKSESDNHQIRKLNWENKSISGGSSSKSDHFCECTKANYKTCIRQKRLTIWKCPFPGCSELHGENARPKHILQHVSAHIALKDVRGGETKVNCPRCGWCGSNQNLCVIKVRERNLVTNATTIMIVLTRSNQDCGRKNP